MGYEDLRFLRDRTAYWLGIKCLQDRKLLKITQPIKEEFMKTKEYFRRTMKPTGDSQAMKELYKVLNSIVLGETV